MSNLFSSSRCMWTKKFLALHHIHFILSSTFWLTILKRDNNDFLLSHSFEGHWAHQIPFTFACGMISRSTEKFTASWCGFQSGNERALLSFLSFLTLAPSLYVHIILVLTLVWLFQVFVFFINLENSKSILFSGMCTELSLFSFILILFPQCQVTSIMTEVISDGCRERNKKTNGELCCVSFQSNANDLIWRNC